jgi:phospholipase/carboxylesterase
LLDALGGLLAPLLGTLERVGWVQRHLYPPVAPRLAEELAPCAAAIAGPLKAVEALECPQDLRFIRDPLVEASRQTLDLVKIFVEAAQPPGEPMGLYRALRRFARVQETLYPLAPVFDGLSRWFLEPARRDDDALVARLRAAALRDDDDARRTGVLHASNGRDERGGFSLYVPE